MNFCVDTSPESVSENNTRRVLAVDGVVDVVLLLLCGVFCCFNSERRRMALVGLLLLLLLMDDGGTDAMTLLLLLLLLIRDDASMPLLLGFSNTTSSSSSCSSNVSSSLVVGLSFIPENPENGNLLLLLPLPLLLLNGLLLIHSFNDLIAEVCTFLPTLLCLPLLINSVTIHNMVPHMVSVTAIRVWMVHNIYGIRNWSVTYTNCDNSIVVSYTV